MTEWPRRKRSAVDDAMLTSPVAQPTCKGSEAGRTVSTIPPSFYDPAEPIAVDGMRESFSQRREREYAHAWRVRLGPEAWQELVTAYAEEIRQNLEDENRIHDRKEAK